MLTHDEISPFANHLMQQEERMFLLFKEPLSALLSREAHEVWWYEGCDRTGFYYEDKAYQAYLDHNKAITEGLAAINSLHVYDTFTHGDYCYKVLVLTDWALVHACLIDYDLFGHIEGIFSWDSDLVKLKRKIMAQTKYVMPETLAELGCFAILSRRDQYSLSDEVIFSCAHPPYVAQILESAQQRYQQRETVNIETVNY